jgi:Endomembrane protein 70
MHEHPAQYLWLSPPLIRTRVRVLQWYLRPSVIALMGGLLPFGSIFIEVYYILTGEVSSGCCPCQCCACHHIRTLQRLPCMSCVGAKSCRDAELLVLHMQLTGHSRWGFTQHDLALLVDCFPSMPTPCCTAERSTDYLYSPCRCTMCTALHCWSRSF